MRRTVLVVEDEALVRECAVCAFEEAGFTVVDRGTADEALAYLAGHPGTVTVLFTDIQMPGQLSGLDLAQIVGRQWPTLPVLVTSGGVVCEPGQLPASARFVPKPWRVEDVLRRVLLLLAACEPAPPPLRRAG